MTLQTTIRSRCTTCQAVVAVSVINQGKKVRCPKCKIAFVAAIFPAEAADPSVFNGVKRLTLPGMIDTVPKPAPIPMVPFETLLTQPVRLVEIRRRVHKPEILANLIGSFANTEGGHIVIGYDRKKQKTLRIKRKNLEWLVQKAEELLKIDLAKLEFEAVNKRDVAIISVGRIDRVVASPGGLFCRDDHGLCVMNKTDIHGKLSRITDFSISDASGMIFSLSTALERTTKSMDELNATLSPLGRAKKYFLEKTLERIWVPVSAALGIVGTLLWEWLSKWLG